MNHGKSRELFASAQKFMPGGVNSPVRAFAAIDMDPVVIRSAKDCYIEDVDGNRYIDYVGSWGPMIIGHTDERVMAAVCRALARGASFGAPTELENKLAEQVIAAVPSIELVRMVNSGTEATMSAIRVARGYTGRDLLLKFEGCYHGHSDSLLVKAGSGAATLGVPSSSGVPAALANLTCNLPYNDLAALEGFFKERGSDLAAVIIEPVCGNMGVVAPTSEFLNGLRRLCTEYGVVLIFDEVMTGFRVSFGGAQELYGVTPDMTTLGKIIGGGLPVGAFGGKREIMEQVAPLGSVYQAGTLSGNPLAMAAGLATLEVLQEPGVYAQLEAKSARLCDGLEQAAQAAGVVASFNRVGAMFTTFFTDRQVKNWDDADSCNRETFSMYYKLMLEAGIYLAPSQFEAGFMSLKHGDDEIERTITAARGAFKKLAAKI